VGSPPRGRKTPKSNPRKVTSLKNQIKWTKYGEKRNERREVGCPDPAGGGIVPAPPRSGDFRESSDGLSAPLEASGADKRVIAAKDRMMDVEGCPSSRSVAAADEELNWMKELGCIVLSKLGATNREENITITERAMEETKEILEGDILNFTTDLLSEMIATLISHKITKNEKRIDANVGINAVRFVIAVLENRMNQKEEQIGSLKMYRKKYEELINKMTKEKEEKEETDNRKNEASTQTEDNDTVVLTQAEGNMEVELEVEQDRETNRKLDEILNRIANIEKREERRKDTSPAWAQVLGRKERKKATRDSSQTSLPGRKLPSKEAE